MAKRVLIITYHFPPINVIASRRFGEMAPLMKRFGFEPYVLTTKSQGDLPVLIPEKNIVRIGEHCDSKKKIVQEEGFKGIPLFLKPVYFLYRKLNIRIESIDRFVFSWKREVLKNIDKIKEINPDVIIATTSPIVCLWLGRDISKILNKPWIADFRDACSLFNPSNFPLVRSLDKKIDRYVVKTASLITSYGSRIGDEMRNFYKKETHVIFNGFKQEKMENLNYIKEPQEKKIIYYAGRFHSHRVPAVKMFIDWLSQTSNQNLYLKIRSLGPAKANKEILDKIKEKNLEDRIELLLPASAEKVSEEEKQADFLAIFGDLETQNEIFKGSMPGKLFEYLPYNGTILAVVRSDSDIKSILEETNRGEVVSNFEELDAFFLKQKPVPNLEKLKTYTREFQTQKLCRLLGRVVNTYNLLTTFKIKNIMKLSTNMNLETLILKEIKKKKKIKVADIVKATGFSRAYVSRTFKKLKEDKKIFQTGKANKARYIFVGKKGFDAIKKEILKSKKMLKNKNVSESDVLEGIKEETGIFFDIAENISAILDYAFTEILNNAIEHSKSDKITIVMERKPNLVLFEITDFGIGIFNNIIEKRGLKNELEAIQDLLKGKQTTAPEEHSGEGVFFTSKIAGRLIIRSFGKKLIVDNIINDIFIEDIKGVKGTIVRFEISAASKKDLSRVFREYSEGAFDFNKTRVTVDLYNIDTSYISRSQARRVLSGLDKFKKIILDFKDVKTVGQSFADEVFRVWKNKHKDINIVYKNANENIVFMIKRAKKE